jgi:hypothetical protein
MTAFSPCTHGLFLKRTNLSYRQDAKAAKANKIHIFACGKTASGKLGVLGVLAVKYGAHVEFQAKTMSGSLPAIEST